MKTSDGLRGAGAAERYLDLLKRALLNELGLENELRIAYLEDCITRAATPDAAVLHDIRFARAEEFAALSAARRDGRFDPGRNRPGYGHTMIGRARLDDLEAVLAVIARDGVAGDLLEAGVWRGGSAIFLRAFLAAYGIEDRQVWLADSFVGLPPGEVPRSAELGRDLAVSAETVRDAFARYGLLDERVRFLEGWFSDTLPTAPIERLALLRLDGDLFTSTMTALDALYDKLAPGGFAIIDDYHALVECKLAVDAFRRRRQINAPLHRVDWTCVRWRKEA